MDPDEYIQRKYGLAVNGSSPMPVEIPNVGRRDLAKLFHELGYKLGVEVGVEAAHYTEVLGQEMPDATIWAVDAWQAYRGYRDHVTQGKLETFYRRAEGRVAQFKGRVRLVRKFSLDAAKDFGKRTLDFVYIDANHDFRHVAEDIDTWSDKVRVGVRALLGHDRAAFIAGYPYDISPATDERPYFQNFFRWPVLAEAWQGRDRGGRRCWRPATCCSPQRWSWRCWQGWG